MNATMQIHYKLTRKSTSKITKQQLLATLDQTHRSAQNFFPFIHSGLFKVSELIKSLPRRPHPWGSFIFTQRIMGTRVLLCFCIKQAETTRTWEIWAENFLQNQYGSEVKTTPFEFALSWVSFITAVRLCDGLTLSLVDWLVLASSDGFIQEVCVVYLRSLVTVWVPGLRCLRTVCLRVLDSWDEKKKEGQRHRTLSSDIAYSWLCEMM